MSILEKIKKGFVHPHIKATLDHNKKIKESRKRTMENNVDALIDEKADEVINYGRRGRKGFKINRIHGWPNTNKCYEGCGRVARHKMFIAELCDQCYQKEQAKKERSC